MSLAAQWRERAVGVVLSGSDRDGTRGLAAVRGAGGLVLAQGPETAQYPSMPVHVIEAGLADEVLPPAQIAQRLADVAGTTPGAELRATSQPEPTTKTREESAGRLLEAAQRMLAADDSRPGAIIDLSGHALAFRGDVSDFLTVSTGPFALDLPSMLAHEAGERFGALLEEASEGGRASANVMVAGEAGGPHEVELEIMKMDEKEEDAYLVLFLDVSPDHPVATAPAEDAGEGALRTELAKVRRGFQEASEAKDALNEELQSSIEEAQSVNEELQTAKEELQSTNEELVTVNDELQQRNSDLSDLNDDLTSLLTSVDIPILVLGHELEIRRFTPGMRAVFAAAAAIDVGRPLSDLRIKMEIPDLDEHLRADSRLHGRPREQEVHDESGHWYSLRLRAYCAEKGTPRGVVISLLDIEEQKRASGQLEDELRFSNDLIDTVREPLVVLDASLNVNRANAAFYAFFHAKRASTEGRQLAQLGAGQWDVEELTALLERVLSENVTFQDFRVTYRFPKIGQRTVELNARRVVRGHLGGEFVLLAMEDITDSVARTKDASGPTRTDT